jgi:HK97 family phage major capsid protein
LSDLAEVKKIIEDQGHAWEEFKKANNELIKAKAEGKAVAELEQKVDAINGALEKFSDERKKIEDFMVKMTSPGSVQAEDKDAAAELKNFNLIMRSEYQLKGKPIPQMFDQDAYKNYKSGFFKLVSGQNMDNLEPEERKAMQAGSDPDGGYLLPASTVGRTVAKIYEQSTIRQLASVQTISTDAIEGLLDNDEADAGWVSELGTRSNTATPQLGKWRVEAHELYAMPKISQKLLDDASTDVEGWLSNKIADKFARVEDNAGWNGTGVGQWRGLATYTTAATGDDARAWGQFEHVKTGTNGDFNATTKADCLHDLVGAFKNQYLSNARWVMRREVRTKLRKLKGATSDLYLWEPSFVAGQPDQLNGYPVIIDQYLPALATDSLSIAFGDFKEAYLIVDRIGIRTLRDPYTAKPYIVFYSTKRSGAGATNFESVKFIKFSS